MNWICFHTTLFFGIDVGISLWLFNKYILSDFIEKTKVCTPYLIEKKIFNKSK